MMLHNCPLFVRASKLFQAFCRYVNSNKIPVYQELFIMSPTGCDKCKHHPPESFVLLLLLVEGGGLGDGVAGEGEGVEHGGRVAALVHQLAEHLHTVRRHLLIKRQPHQLQHTHNMYFLTQQHSKKAFIHSTQC